MIHLVVVIHTTENTNMNDLCNRCGECCSYQDEKGRKKYCSQLIKQNDGKTSCSVYNNRIGTTIYKDLRCSDRLEDERFHPGCPYNLYIAKKLNML